MESIHARDRVNTALSHESPDRLPVDLLAVPEVWEQLKKQFSIPATKPSDTDLFDPTWETVLEQLSVDCRVVSYDQFCSPPASSLKDGARVEWWDVASRSTPGRMWRQQLPSGELYDIFGRCFKIEHAGAGAYESVVPILGHLESIGDFGAFRWPEPDWWDFTRMPEMIKALNRNERHHMRFRSGSIFEVAWQLRGLEQFLIDLAVDPAVAEYLMDRITEILLETTKMAMDVAGDFIDMVYFYDDVATQRSLMISKDMWAKYIWPRHRRMVDLIKSHGKQVMYHSDGSIYEILPALIDTGVDVINPVQADAAMMEPERLKSEFGDRLSFHGGIDIIKTLPQGSTEDVKSEVLARRTVLGDGGGYIMASCHHIQSETPNANVLAMYDLDLR